MLKRIRRAFTLMELMMVLVILTIIMTFVIPSYKKTSDKMTEKTAAWNLISIRTGLNLYKTAQGGYPTFNLNNANAISNTLGIAIIPGNITYQCILMSSNTYDCQATTSAGWQVHIESGFIPGDPHCNSTNPPCPTCTMTAKCPFLP